MEEDKLTKEQEKAKFIESYEGASKADLLREMLYAQKLQLEKSEKIRSNTSKLVWWLVAIPILISVFI